MENVECLELFRRARSVYTQKELAELLDRSERTIARWENGQAPMPRAMGYALAHLIQSPARPHRTASFTFIDLFAGIGGIRIGFESAGGKCVFTSEWDKHANKTYLANFDTGHPMVGDIVPFPARNVPDHDVLLAGFPCQPFSIAGVSKKNALGRPHGFQDTTQGTLFFDVARIIDVKRPKAFLLENVKNLRSHDRGNTFKIIKETLELELGYQLHTAVVDGRRYVPQHRERILMIGFREPVNFSFSEWELPEEAPLLKSILHPEDGSEDVETPYTIGELAAVDPKYVLSDHLWQYLQDYAAKHRAAGNGFGYGLVDAGGVARTLSARYYKDGSEILISRGPGRNPRRLTPRECARLMGFPEWFRIPVSDTQAYKQFGNSVVVPVMSHAARLMAPHLDKIKLTGAEDHGKKAVQGNLSLSY